MLTNDITSYLDRRDEITKRLGTNNNDAIKNSNSVRTTPSRNRDDSPVEKKQRIIIRMAARSPSKTTKDSLEGEGRGSQGQGESGVKRSGTQQK